MFSSHNSKVTKAAQESLPTLPRTSFLKRQRGNEALFMCAIPVLFSVWGVLSFYESDKNVVRAPMRFEQINATIEKGQTDVSAEFILANKHAPVAHDGANLINPATAGLVVKKPSEAITPVNDSANNSDNNSGNGCSVARANIIDRNGNILAANVLNKSQLQFNRDLYSFKDDAERLFFARQLAAIIPTKPIADIVRLLQKPRGYVFVAEGLSPKQVQDLKDKVDDRFSSMMQINAHDSRVYPKGEMFAQVIGSVKSDFCAVDGVEKILNAEILSTEGEVKTSLDENFQHILSDEIFAAMNSTGAVSGYGMIMDIHTGHVLSQVSLPSYDVNQRTYMSNFDKANYNIRARDLTGEYMEFGSIFKIFNTALALNEGVGLYDVFETKKPMYTGKYLIREDHPENFDLNMLGIFLRSNNRGSARIALQAGHEKQVALFEKLGLIRAGELNGAGKTGKSAIATRAYGYGVMTSMSNISAAVASMTNGGILVQPEYLASNTGRTDIRVLDTEKSNILRRMMLTNVTHQKGTGKNAYRDGVMIGVKTGTSKVHVAATAENKAHYGDDTRASVVGVFPMDKPKYVVMVTLLKPYDEKGKPANSGVVTAPVVGNVAQRIALAEGFLKTAEESREYEQSNSYSYIHEPEGRLRIAQN